MKKILWLPSWYPSDIDKYKGDFIQRHAKAAALYHQVHVLYVIKTEKTNSSIPANQYTKNENLTEEIIYYRASSSPLIAKLSTLMQYFQLNHLSIQHYIKKNGKPDCIHVHVPIKSGIIALWLRWRYGIPYMLTEHYGIYNNRVEESFPKRSLLFKLLTKRIIQSASQFLPVSASIGGNINEMVTKKPFQVIKNTVNTSFFYYVPPPTRSVFIFMHASNMVSVKNVEGIIAGMEALWQYRQDAVLWLTGTTTPSVQKAAAKSALFNKSIFFTGEISYINVALKMQQSHATILFSYSENMPCVILESLCCGRPVIASRVGGIPEVVNDQNGLFVESGNVLQLTNAMLQLMENYSNYNLESIASKAASLYSYSSIGKEMAKIYEL